MEVLKEKNSLRVDTDFFLSIKESSKALYLYVQRHSEVVLHRDVVRSPYLYTH